MLPAHIAQNIRKQVEYYLQATFSFLDKQAEKAFSLFINDPENGMFKGPWFQLKRPFRPAPENIKIPLDTTIPFNPFLHQYKSWLRLSSRNQTPKSTIVTTGTGSGKTECFLYPILDHCLREKKKGQNGIKAIILYPMNALASDQERRFAETVLKDPELTAAGIRVGNYTGRFDPSDPGSGRESGTKSMGKGKEGESYHGISNHKVLQEFPPDILLTNYRMLDFLLMRPRDQELWRFNTPGILKYLVLDELHTYDGAQGADVACLIRRLKEKLEISKGEMCVVGTSATLDENKEDIDVKITDGSIDAMATGKDKLAAFATILFEEEIQAEAVIGEERLEVEDIVKSDLFAVDIPDVEQCHNREDEDALTYAIRQSEIWGGPLFSGDINTAEDVAAFKLELGDWLKGSKLFKAVLNIFKAAEMKQEDPIPWNLFVKKISQADFEINAIQKNEDKSTILSSFCSLISHASEKRSGRPFPLVPTQVQLWIRELRRLGRLVHEKPGFIWLDEPSKNIRSLPAFHCSECGASGWISMVEPDKDTVIKSEGVEGHQLIDDPRTIYQGWFGIKGRKDQHMVVITPFRNVHETNDPFSPSPFMEKRVGGEVDGQVISDPFLNEKEYAIKTGEQHDLPGMESDGFYLCRESLVLRKGYGTCPLTGSDKLFRVEVDKSIKSLENGSVVGAQRCPKCLLEEGIFFIGCQSATLSSVIIDEMFGSVLNNDPKLLAFTDSVQDASHRAGYFSARTYHFTYRTALQHVINEAGFQGLPVKEAGDKLLTYWSLPLPGRPGSIKEAMASLLPPDLSEYLPYTKYRNNEKLQDPPPALYKDVETRLKWQAVSEFGFMLSHGRTMEKNGAACMGWQPDFIDRTIDKLKDRIEGISPVLTKLTDDRLRLWLFGFLHRCRESGALYHPYLDSYAKQNYWGKYPFGRAVPGRETYPPAIRYRPKLMVTSHKKEHVNVLAPSSGGRHPWHLLWTARALERPAVSNTDYIDLLKALLNAGHDAGLFVKLHQDSKTEFFAISQNAATLFQECVKLACSETDKFIVKPPDEASVFLDAPSMEYYADKGVYRQVSFDPRQKYYQDRYQKGALRRVVAQEHTGILDTELREKIENDFKTSSHKDDPNVLACTSTLEMGIDIGDLSSTMLCSIPPTTSNYLQRIGRAGRSTGTALIISIINQRPHDLFFYARPSEMIKGQVAPPGCWLDASAVLARQYLGFCFDSAVKAGKLMIIPASCRQFIKDMNDGNGAIISMMTWVSNSEKIFQNHFLNRFESIPGIIKEDTKERFYVETATELILQKIHQVAGFYDRTIRDLENAKNRLNSQRSKLNAEEADEAKFNAEEVDEAFEIDQEMKIITTRLLNINRLSTLEILTGNGLLPNYAFPERGVGFYGAVYNRHRRTNLEVKPVDLYRGASSAIRELAPGNTFYTHKKHFVIQQITMGNPNQPLAEKWGICGNCGFVAPLSRLKAPGASPDCPQCGHEGDSDSLFDLGQQKDFIHFSDSQALSYMEYYDSLSGDKTEEREQLFYNIVSSFDLTLNSPKGAAGEDTLPFGIEYRTEIILRVINGGYLDQGVDINIGPNQKLSENGFFICKDCGVVVPPGVSKEKFESYKHRKSCKARKRYDTDRQYNTHLNPFQWERIFLYRELKSEAIRLLLPVIDDQDIDTLIACIYLGLRLRFEGDPAHLIVLPHILPDKSTGLTKHYLILMDAVPGGTGFLKTLFQEKNEAGIFAEGIMDILERAKNALMLCSCRNLKQKEDDTDGCYRCLRTYHLQYKSEKISRERGIKLLEELLEAGRNRVTKGTLEDIKPDSLFGSVLEKRFVDALEAFVETQKGRWESTIIKGAKGFRFEIFGRLWELELQPRLGKPQGVMTASQPDFLLTCDDESIRPVAVFTDGFEYHCYPNNRLADDMMKRRAILESEKFWVWNITWDDLHTDRQLHLMVCPKTIAAYINKYTVAKNSLNITGTDPWGILYNGFEQIKAFLKIPYQRKWQDTIHFITTFTLSTIAAKDKKYDYSDLIESMKSWQTGQGLKSIESADTGTHLFFDQISFNQDILAFSSLEDVLLHKAFRFGIFAHLGDTEFEINGSDFNERWRRFLACLNFYQFHDNFSFWTTSEAENGTAPDFGVEEEKTLSQEWQEIKEETVSAFYPLVERLAMEASPIPEVEFYNDAVDGDAFAELAWPDLSPPVAVLAGEQIDFSEKWQGDGWKVVVPDDLEINGLAWFLNIMSESR
ncbi:putative RNA helicase [Desulfamplus magnetovallimortis]|uniref:Putative RNA helicase n=1 Tax=Desulfamplus magnetovallimortis TaxID=1246637 RepID=A0A1W1HH11_9BACT|nr:DEAD/DEAH box helicase [Desulfamplus magnetovallimortis]SLM31713.1 putative RNA helicase [Desulfamplus magnetovallimortis]